MSSASRGLAPCEGLGFVLMKTGRAGPPLSHAAGHRQASLGTPVPRTPTVVVLQTKPSGLYRHRRGLGLHRVGYKEGDLHIYTAKLAFHAKESPIRTRDEVFQSCIFIVLESG